MHLIGNGGARDVKTSHAVKARMESHLSSSRYSDWPDFFLRSDETQVYPKDPINGVKKDSKHLKSILSEIFPIPKTTNSTQRNSVED